jgi:hypothetical protein
MPKFTNVQEITAAIEDCVEHGGKLLLRFGHGQIRQLGWEDSEMLLNALRTPAPEATAGSKLEEELAMLVRRLAARIRLRSKTGPHATPDNATFHNG